MIPIKRGTAQKLGLRKPNGVIRYRDGSTVYIDETNFSRFGITMNELASRERIRDFAEACGVSLADWQVDWVARCTPPLRR